MNLFSSPSACRRDDPTIRDPSTPSLGARASALTLAVLLKGCLDSPPSEWDGKMGSGAGSGGASAAAAGPGAGDVVMGGQEAGPSSFLSSPTPSSAPAYGAMHLVRLSEEANIVLFDSRRRTCHVMIFNFFISIGGLDSILAR